MERGRIGERYILGHQNLTLREIFQMLSGLTGIPAPRLKLPWQAILPLAHVESMVRRLHQPAATPHSIGRRTDGEVPYAL